MVFAFGAGAGAPGTGAAAAPLLTARVTIWDVKAAVALPAAAAGVLEVVIWRFGWNQCRSVVETLFCTTSVSIMKTMNLLLGSSWPWALVSMDWGIVIVGAWATATGL